MTIIDTLNSFINTVLAWSAVKTRRDTAERSSVSDVESLNSLLKQREIISLQLESEVITTDFTVTSTAALLFQLDSILKNQQSEKQLQENKLSTLSQDCIGCRTSDGGLTQLGKDIGKQITETLNLIRARTINIDQTQAVIDNVNGIQTRIETFKVNLENLVITQEDDRLIIPPDILIADLYSIVRTHVRTKEDLPFEDKRLVLQSIDQVWEEFQRNDITEDSARQLFISLAGGTIITKKEIETIADIDPTLKLKLDENFDLVLKELTTDIDNGFTIANHIPHETDLILKQSAKERLDNIVNDNIPRSIDNVNRVITNFIENGFNITILQDDRFRAQLKRHDTLLILAGAIIDESEALQIIAGIQISNIKSVVV